MMSDLQRVLAARRRAKEAEEGGSADGSAAGGDQPGQQGSNATSRWPAGSTQSGNTSVTNSSIPPVPPLTSTASSGNNATSSSSIVPGFATLRKNSSAVLDAMNGNSAITNGTNSGNGCSATSAATGMLSRADLEAFKRELMSEFRREVQQLKNDVIEALRAATARD
ncbi:unnamed protein product [Echinostoma caproni]|uniref:VASP_tetra domain-containing protein n=1 Tax=Echinostoma caproni TaxID=27848 RepID=A0A183A212_9TREM|nr:unnamed protein product [Echinostoma caproni]